MLAFEVTFSVPKSALSDSKGLNMILLAVLLAMPQGVSPSPVWSMPGSVAAATC